jgi:hypothetical protein
MDELPVVDAIPLIQNVQKELIGLLRNLSQEEWYVESSSTLWNVKDIAAHLLDGDIRRLSLHRDNHKLQPPSQIEPSYNSLVQYLNQLNNLWVDAAKRFSPKLIISLTEILLPQVIGHFKNLDPDGIALFPVAWAGEETSSNRFDFAREYTEKWHHQQQIREATGRPLLIGRKWLHPLIETLIRGVPPMFNRETGLSVDETIGIRITGAFDDRWVLKRSGSKMKMYKSKDSSCDTEITMDDNTAWRLFTKSMTAGEAREKMEVRGNPVCADLLSQTVSFMK